MEAATTSTTKSNMISDNNHFNTGRGWEVAMMMSRGQDKTLAGRCGVVWNLNFDWFRLQSVAIVLCYRVSSEKELFLPTYWQQPKKKKERTWALTTEMKIIYTHRPWRWVSIHFYLAPWPELANMENRLFFCKSV